MGISQGLTKVTQQMQDGVRFTMMGILVWAVKLFSSGFISVTLAIIAQEVTGFGMLALLFVFVLITGVLMRIMHKWSALNVLVFDLVCVLVGLSIKMYILLAP